MWKAKILDSKTAEEQAEQPGNIFYFWVNGQQKETDLILTCFCTLTHEYTRNSIIYCDGNPPEEEPLMD